MDDEIKKVVGEVFDDLVEAASITKVVGEVLDDLVEAASISLSIFRPSSS
jgi:hypothetical protein